VAGSFRETLIKRASEFIKQRSKVEIAFDIGIFLKGFNGVIEVLGGLLLLFVQPETLSRLITSFTQYELSEDEHDIVASFLAQYFSATQVFAGIYLFVHGMIKVFLVESLLRKRLWAYPLAMLFFFLFIIYQLYRYYLNGSMGMILLSILDLIVIALTWLEYRRLKKARSDT
jgi:uncharacterized membrane protein